MKTKKSKIVQVTARAEPLCNNCAKFNINQNLA